MKRKKILITITSLMVLSFGVITCKGKKHCEQGQFLEEKANQLVDKYSRKLKLNEAQQSTMQGIKDEVLAKREATQTKGREVYSRLLSEWDKESLDPESLIGFWNENKQFLDEMVVFSINKLAQFHAMLTSEQRAKIKAKLDKKKSCQVR